MLRKSFLFFKGIGPGAQAKLEKAGVQTWDDALEAGDNLPLGPTVRTRILGDLVEAQTQFDKTNAQYFVDLVKPKEGWRIFSSFPKKCVYYDLETTGLEPGYDEITTLTTYCPATRRLMTFVQGETLEYFFEEVDSDTVLVGFNNRAFDSRFLTATFGDVAARFPQIDLRWILHGMGIKGKLKEIEERTFGIHRPQALQGFDGFDAVNAWWDWKHHGDRDALDRLVYYNQADTMVLDYLMREVCRRHGCSRFSALLSPEIMFRSASSVDWPQALPDIDLSAEARHRTEEPACDQGPVVGVPAPRPPPAVEGPAVQAAEDDDQAASQHYQMLFLMALADECVTREERCVLDLFAAKYGLSRREQEDTEHRARDEFNRNGLDSITEYVLSHPGDGARWFVQELVMFSWIDGHLDAREQALLIRLAVKAGMDPGVIQDLRSEAIQLGKELLLQ